MKLPESLNKPTTKKKNLMLSFVICFVLAMMILLIRFSITPNKARNQIISEPIVENTNKPTEKPTEEPKNEIIDYKLNLIPVSINNKFNFTYDPIQVGNTDAKCSDIKNINENLSYTILQNVCVFPNGYVENTTFTYYQPNSCQFKIANQISDDSKISLDKAIYISQNTYKDQQIIYELPLLSVIPHEIRETHTLLIPNSWTNEEIRIVETLGYNKHKNIPYIGACAKELFVLTGLSCNEFSLQAVHSFVDEISKKYWLRDKNQKTVVIAGSPESNQKASEVKADLNDLFPDVTFLYPPDKSDLYKYIKFWAEAKIVISCPNCTGGNEIWMQPGSALISLSPKCHDVHSFIASSLSIHTTEYITEHNDFEWIIKENIVSEVEKYINEFELSAVKQKAKSNEDDIF